MRAGLKTGHNVDAINVARGLEELKACGYDDMHTILVIEHALCRWARGEEEAAQRGAIDSSFYGVNLTSWLRILAAAQAGALQEVKIETGVNPSLEDTPNAGLKA